MCLNLAIKSHYESKYSKSSDSTPASLETVYMNEINYLNAISNAFK